MAHRVVIALAVSRCSALQATQHRRSTATRAGAAPSLFDAPATDELETLEASMRPTPDTANLLNRFLTEIVCA